MYSAPSNPDIITAIIAEEIYKQIEKEPFNYSKRISIDNNYIYLGSYKQTERNENQDRVICAQISLESKTDVVIVAVADGMGGLDNGGIAASDTLSYFVSYIATNCQKMSQHECVKKAVLFADSMVFKKYKRKAGSTLASIVYYADKIVCVNVGDSRIYQLNSGELAQVSQDDSHNALLAAILPSSEQNQLKEGLFETLDSRLTQHIGIGEGLDPHILSFPAHRETLYTNFLLTTDGVHYLGKDLLNIIVSKSATPEDIVKRCISISDWLGGHDNATIVISPSSLHIAHANNNNKGIAISICNHIKSSNIIIMEPAQNTGYFNYVNTSNQSPKRMYSKKTKKKSARPNPKKESEAIEQQETELQVFDFQDQGNGNSTS